MATKPSKLTVRGEIFDRDPTPLYAVIRADSKYEGQTPPGQLFQVSVAYDPVGYVLNGGPGGRYRLQDVHLYAKTEGGKYLKLT